MFRIAAQDDASGLFRLDADEETQRVYPFDFRLDMAFAVEGVSLSMTATVMNRGSEDMPFSFGFHPAFAWPLPYGRSEEHTSELQSLMRISYDVFCLKKKNNYNTLTTP